MIKSFLRLPSFNLAQSSPLGGAALSRTVQSFHFNQVPLQRTIVFLYRWRQTETQRLHTIKKQMSVHIGYDYRQSLDSSRWTSQRLHLFVILT